MALTATATKTLRRDIARIIGMRNELIVSRPPVKSNVNNGKVKGRLHQTIILSRQTIMVGQGFRYEQEVRDDKWATR